MLLLTPPHAAVCCCFAINCFCSSAFSKLFNNLLSNNHRKDHYDFFIVSGQILATEASCMDATKSTAIFSQRKSPHKYQQDTSMITSIKRQTRYRAESSAPKPLR